MEDTLNKFKNSLLKAKEETGKFTKTAVKKTKTTIESTKYKYSASEIESKTKELLVMLGEKLYNEYKNGAEFEENIESICSQLDKLNEEAEAVKLKIAQLKGGIVCEGCGEIIDAESEFCPKCGMKIEQE